MKKKLPIAITIGTLEDKILARADKRAEKKGVIQILDFVRIKNTIGRIIQILDDHDFPRENAISLKAKYYLKTGKGPDPKTEEMVYKKLVIEPLGRVLLNGEVAEYQGGIGYFVPVYRASSEEIAKLYPKCEGITIGKIASGYRVTDVEFQLGLETALSRHLAIFGKNGTGKTNLLKEIIASNLELENPIPMLVFGHPDLGLDNPHDKGTRGVTALNDERIVTVGYLKKIKLSPDEISLSDIFDQFEMSTPMRDLWYHMQAREPKRYIEILAKYDLNLDPYRIHRRQIKDPQTGDVRTVGIASMPTIDAVCKQARILSNYIDPKAPPILSKILSDLKMGKIVLINTFEMSEYYQGLFVKLLLKRLQRAGKYSLHKGIRQRFLVIIDEAQHFIRTAGDSIAEFVMECRKFGITLVLSTQSPRSIPERVAGQIYSTISFHLNKADLKLLVDNAPMLEECKYMISHPPLKNTLGLGIVQALGYPYPAVIKVPRFERRLEN